MNCQNFINIKDAIAIAIDKLENSIKLNNLSGIKSGFMELDFLTGGFQKSDFIVLAGRAGQGKTDFALNIMRNVAVDYDIPVAFFNFELSFANLIQRLLCAEANINFLNMKSGKMSEKHWELLNMRVGRLASAPIYIYNNSILLSELCEQIRKIKQEKNNGLVIIDYLQLIRMPEIIENARSENYIISLISKELKLLAKELEIPIIAISPLNNKGINKPKLSDFNEFESLAQDADIVIFIHRPETYENEISDENRNLAEIIISKNRNGAVGEFNLTFQKEYCRFEKRITISKIELEEMIKGNRKKISLKE